MNAVAAKQFPIARGMEEADLQPVLISDLETKMLVTGTAAHLQFGSKSGRMR